MLKAGDQVERAWAAYDEAALRLARLQKDAASTHQQRFDAAMEMRRRWGEFDRLAGRPTLQMAR